MRDGRWVANGSITVRTETNRINSNSTIENMPMPAKMITGGGALLINSHAEVLMAIKAAPKTCSISARRESHVQKGPFLLVGMHQGRAKLVLVSSRTGA
jgi:hypothetical protein